MKMDLAREAAPTRLEVDAALFTALPKNLRKEIPVIEVACAINDPPFAQRCAAVLLESPSARSRPSDSLKSDWQG